MCWLCLCVEKSLLAWLLIVPIVVLLCSPLKLRFAQFSAVSSLLQRVSLLAGELQLR